MPHPPPEPLLDIREAARRLKLHHSTLQEQVNRGQVRAHEGKVRLSEVQEDRARNMATNRPGGRKKGGGSRRHPPRHPPAPATRQPSPASTGDASAETLAEAQRRKEIALADKHELDLGQKTGRLVERAGAEKLFGDTARDFRDGLMAWPARDAILMADKIRVDPATGKVDARSLTDVLSAHINQHLNDIGEPFADL